MARTFRLKVNRLVTYIRANAERQPAQVRSFAGDVVTLRVQGESSNRTSVAKRTAHNQTNVWAPP